MSQSSILKKDKSAPCRKEKKKKTKSKATKINLSLNDDSDDSDDDSDYDPDNDAVDLMAELTELFGGDETRAREAAAAAAMASARGWKCEEVLEESY